MIGRQLGHYRIVESLGQGGMGAVYLAEDTKLERRAALKVLPPELASDRRRLRRFAREAKALAALNHPNIVTIYAVEEIDGTPFLAMEWIDGKPLGELVPATGLPLDRLIDLAVPLAEALAAAHRADITHRDLKPDNIMVDREGRPRLLDFGLAKSQLTEVQPGRGETAPPPLTAPGAVMGTLRYMSPEQVQGRPVDHRSDIFSLGVVLYEMATGQRPFQGRTKGDLVQAILEDTPAAATSVRPDLPQELDRIIGRCLEKEPAARSGSATEVGAALRALNAGRHSEQPTELAAAASGLLAGPPGRRLGLVAASILGALLVAGITWLTIDGPDGSRPAPGDSAAVDDDDRPQRLMVLPFENLGAPEDSLFALGMTDELTNQLARLKQLEVVARTSARELAGAGRTIRQIGDELAVDWALEGTIRSARAGEEAPRIRVTPQLIRTADEVYVWVQPYERALLDVFQVQAEIAEKVVSQLGLSLLERPRGLPGPPTRSPEAYRAFLTGQAHRDGIAPYPEDLRSAADHFERAVELDPGYARAWAELGRTHAQIYRDGLDRTSARGEAARLAADEAEVLAPGLPQAILAQASVYDWVSDEPQRALECYERVLLLQPALPEALAARGRLLLRSERVDEGLADLERAAELDPLASEVIGSLVNALRALDRDAAAGEVCDRTRTLAAGAAPPPWIDPLCGASASAPAA